MSEQSNQGRNISALSVPDAAKILASAYGRQITEQQVREVARVGNLLAADGTINLVHYTAFLAKEVSGGSH